MNPIGWRRARAVAAVLATGCQGVDEQLEERPFDAAIHCRPSAAPVFSTVAEAMAVLDADGDGALTDTDLRPGEAAVIVALIGTHTATGEVSDPGFTIHTDWDSFTYAAPVDHAFWGVQVTTNCLPMLNVFVNFGDTTLPAGPLARGDFEEVGIGLDVVNLEMHAVDPTMDATVRLTGAAEDRASGYLTGSGSSAFLRLIPEEAPTGQRLSVEAFAFREILNSNAD